MLVKKSASSALVKAAVFLAGKMALLLKSGTSQTAIRDKSFSWEAVTRFGVTMEQLCFPNSSSSEEKAMQAKYPGRCQNCGLSFPAGTSIFWSKTLGARHAYCPKTKPADRPREPREVSLNDGPMSLYEYCQQESGGL